MKRLMSGNAAIARGAWEAGVHYATGYPGTPSTEILENLSEYADVGSEWSTNEKVAFDEGMGAALGGIRTLVTMKHVGLNVAADPFMVFPYAGTNGGFVVLVADANTGWTSADALRVVRRQGSESPTLLQERPIGANAYQTVRNDL